MCKRLLALLSLALVSACSEDKPGSGLPPIPRVDSGTLTLPDTGSNNNQGDSGIVATPDSGVPNNDDAGSQGGPDAGSSLNGIPFFGSGGSPNGPTGCGPTEVCGNGLDDNCNEQVDEGCACTPGVLPCYSGFPAQAGVGLCTMGTQTCEIQSENIVLGACMGEGRPQQVICGQGRDWHCNGIIDEGCNCNPGETRACYSGPANTRGVGLCRDGTQTCVGSGSSADWGPCVGEVLPASQNVCDGQDHLCNSRPAEGCDCVLGTNRACYTGPAGTENVGLCHGGMQACISVNGVPTWGDCNGQVLPAPNTCDGVNRACAADPNQGCDCTIGTTRGCYDGPPGTLNVGLCHGGTQSCVAGPGGIGSTWGTCNGQVMPTQNTCDGIDRMCNGQPGVGCTCTIGQTRACYEGSAATRGIGICRDGQQSCVDQGGVAGWSAGCPGQTLPAAAEICGNNIDDNCAGGVDEGCAPTVTCPASQTVLAGYSAQLTASASSPGRTISRYEWTIVNAPVGGIGTPNQWNPDPPTSFRETFTPYIVGVYTIRVTAYDTANASASCDFNVTAQGHGLRAALTWDGIGDVDLHVHNGNNSPWFSADDCFYQNCASVSGALPWDASGVDDDPRLDFDNTTADGPENISIDVAAIGRTYTIGVHNYAYRYDLAPPQTSPRQATVQIFCGNAATPAATFTSQPLSGQDWGPNCNNNAFWKVATVVFTGPDTCVVTPILNYSLANLACVSL